MGVSIYANGWNGRKFHMGYHGFACLRQRIADDFGIGDFYRSLECCHTDEDFKAYNEALERIAAKIPWSEEDKDRLFDFLYAPDGGYEVDYKTCSLILKVIESDNGPVRMNYVAYSSPDDWERFKDFLRDCVRYKRKMRWI